MGTHPRVLSESYPMSTNMTWFRWFSKVFVLWTKVASAFEELRTQQTALHQTIQPDFHVDLSSRNNQSLSLNASW